jgi:hypothetical protein
LSATAIRNRRKSKQEAVPMSLELDARIEAFTANIRPYIRTIFHEVAKSSPGNASTLCDFLFAEQTEMNIKESTKEWKIKVLVWLSAFFKHQKPYKDMTKQDILQYLNKLRKDDIADPSHKWVGTYNNRVMLFNKFFRC